MSWDCGSELTRPSINAAFASPGLVTSAAARLHRRGKSGEGAMDKQLSMELRHTSMYSKATQVSLLYKKMISNTFFILDQKGSLLTIYAPVNITATCITFSGGQIHYEGG